MKSDEHPSHLNRGNAFEIDTLLGALAHIDAKQRIMEAFQAAWSSHLLQMSDAVQRSLQRGPLSRARG